MRKLQNITFGNNFSDMTPKAQITKPKLDELDFIKVRNFCA